MPAVQHSVFSTNRTGYILSLSNVGTYVVEPFVQDSHLVAPIGAESETSLQFRDVFNVVQWQSVTTNWGFAPLAGLDKFLQDAPRDTILVYFKYPLHADLQKKKRNKEKITHLATGTNYTRGCVMAADLVDKVQYLVTEHHFNVVRKVCINFEYGDELTLFQFNSHVFGNLKPKAHTVLMEQWRGLISSGNRVSILDACWNKLNPILFTWPSHGLTCDADKYASRYLENKQYIALIVRTEKFKIHGVDVTTDHVAACLNKTLSVWKRARGKSKMKTCLSMDVGKYGSYSLIRTAHAKKERGKLNQLYENFFREVLGQDYSIEKWEREFESVASSLDSGYISSLQKTLVARARCIVFSGGGSFQKHAKFLYDKIHQNNCVKIVSSCSRLAERNLHIT